MMHVEIPQLRSGPSERGGMKKKWVIGLLAGWICWAQIPPQTPQQVEAAIEANLKGPGELPLSPEEGERFPFRTIPIDIQPPGSVLLRPTGESISVARLQHRIPKEARQSFERAKKLSKAGDHERAARELEAAILRDPEFAGAHNQLGVEYGQLGRFREAEAAFQHSLELDPNFWGAHLNLGVVLFRVGDLSGAEKSTRRALQHSAEDAKVHLFLGYLLCQREGTKAEGLRHVQYAARTLKEAQRFLRSLQTP
jgi:Flp pilus assembly protein TadD